MTRLLLALTLLISSPASATLFIIDDEGGVIDEYVSRYTMWRMGGDRVVIDGDCQSSCTLVLSMIPLDRVCVTDRAQLAFHSAKAIFFGDDQKITRTEHHQPGTDRLYKGLPKKVKDTLKKKGWSGGEQNKMLWLTPADLEGVVAHCPVEPD